jgi:hypothetical protein
MSAATARPHPTLPRKRGRASAHLSLPRKRGRAGVGGWVGAGR